MVVKAKIKNHKGEDVDGYWGLPEFEAETKVVSEEHRRVEFVISSQSRDRDGDVVDQKGLDTRYWDKTPVVLYSHLNGDKDIPALGLGIELRKELDRKVPRTLSVMEFVEEGLNPRVDMIYRMVSHKPRPYISMASIGFMTNSHEDVTMPGNAEERAALNLGSYGVYFKKSEMLEWSVCPIGSNREASRKSFLFQEPLEKGIIKADDLEWIDRTLGGIWGKLGIVKREQGLLYITEEYHEYLTSKAAPRAQEKSVNLQVSMNDPKAFAAMLEKHSESIRARIREAMGIIPEDQRKSLLEEAEKISKKISPAALTQLSLDRLQSDLDKAVGRFQASGAPGRPATAGGVKNRLKPDGSKGIDLYGNNPDGA